MKVVDVFSSDPDMYRALIERVHAVRLEMDWDTRGSNWRHIVTASGAIVSINLGASNG